MEYELLLLVNTLGTAVIVLIMIYHCFGKYTLANGHRFETRAEHSW